MRKKNDNGVGKANLNDAEKEKIILELVSLRINQMKSTKSLLEHLRYKYHYSDDFSYVLIAESKDMIHHMFKEEHKESFENAKARLEQMIEVTKNEKIRLDAIKEMNKLLGLHKPQKVDITTDGDKINTISVIKLVETKNENNENESKD